MPSIYIDIDLDEFDDEELARHLRKAGYVVTGPKKSVGISGMRFGDVDISELGHIDTLAVCGQTEEAREIALRIVGEAIGRPL